MSNVNMTEKFNLKWNDFQTNVSKSFGLFRNETYLHDVTLVSDDSIHIPTHKLVLSACSEYFKSIFQKTKQSQPIICLEGLNSHDLRDVLDYVYEGEVKIEQDNLDKFLTVAKRLKLEGLIGGEAEPPGNDGKYEPQDQGFKYESSHHVDGYGYEENIEERNVVVPDYDNRKIFHPKKQRNQNTGIIAMDGTDASELVREKTKENTITNPDGSLTCNICQTVFTGVKKSWYMKSHMEVHIDGISYPCQLCDKTFRSKNSFSKHKSVAHRYSFQV